ncbi:MAG: tetratricopeptide repeat protein [Armatimonadetes bacterium]|nr:tetratricopeptide repeat protein [Armatimonadota bacterium]
MDSLRGTLTGETQAASLPLMDAEAHHLRAAPETAIRTNNTRAAYLLCRAAVRWWTIRGLTSDGRNFVTRALALPPLLSDNAESRRLQGELFVAAGTMARSQADYPAAKQWRETAIAYFQRIGDANGEAGALGNLAIVAHLQGDLGQAVQLSEQGLVIQRTTDNRRGVASFLQNLGNHYSHAGRHDDALRCHRESLDLRRELGDSDDIAHSLLNYAAALDESGDAVAARVYAEESLRLMQKIGDIQGAITVLDNLAVLSGKQGDIVAARGFLSDALAQIDYEKAPQDVADLLRTVSTVLETSGDRLAAVRFFAANIHQCRKAGFMPIGREQENHEREALLRAELPAPAYETACLAGENWTLVEAIHEAQILLAKSPRN